MPSKILRDDEGNKFRYDYDGDCTRGLLTLIPKPEPTLEEAINKLDTGFFCASDRLNFAELIIDHIGRVYNLKREDGK